ncbi:hypothetical protein BOTBODRAFT_132264 [Botryobasidium botryosum FD-172 SS1]|uniref:2-dehydropantoate 2-reductase n=1 Tax=Botryobasidium botryosum (strain FD-172 SS1) TaxID=930990 RepID=A0A067MRG4_BOTB1|nr:hypothetical protein BOTBODRAFT_132264 [Botryobasidium botryosum FD-172 SS1]
MRFHVIGVGNIGSLLAFHLRRTLPRPHTVSLIVKQKSFGKKMLAEMRSTITVEQFGIRRSIGGFDIELFNPALKFSQSDFAPKFTPTFSATQTPPNEPKPSGDIAPGGRIESLFVTTKTTQTLHAIRELRGRITPASTIVLLQNGMGVLQSLLSEVFVDPVQRPNFILGTTTHGVWKKGSFDVVHAGMGDIHFCVVPDPLGRRDFERSLRAENRAVAQLSVEDILKPEPDAPQLDDPNKFRSLAATVHLLQQIQDLSPTWESAIALEARLLRKLVVNVCINPLTALIGCKNGELLNNAPAHRIIRGVCAEAAAVFAARAAADPEAYPVPPPKASSLEAEVLRVARATATNYSSMLFDVKHGNRTEVDHINGYLSQLGKLHRVPTPRNDQLLELIKLRGLIPLKAHL